MKKYFQTLSSFEYATHLQVCLNTGFGTPSLTLLPVAVNQRKNDNNVWKKIKTSQLKQPW